MSPRRQEHHQSKPGSSTPYAERDKTNHIKQIVDHCPDKPGCYLMKDAYGKIIYVGKAKRLKRRIQQYFRKQKTQKSACLKAAICDIELVLTPNENQALILEAQLIKNHQPPYNVLLKDDKTYPFLMISDDAFARLQLIRRRKNTGQKGLYGPLADVSSAKKALDILQKTFKIRNCSNGFFSSRRRPCLQYDIKRCSAPCVGLIDTAQYHKDVNDLRMELSGKHLKLKDKLIDRMQKASNTKAYEQAAHYRDMIKNLSQLQLTQPLQGYQYHCWLVGCHIQDDTLAIYHIEIGQHGVIDQSFSLHTLDHQSSGQVLASIIAQRASYGDFPESKALIICNLPIADQPWLIAALKNHHQKPIVCQRQPRCSILKSWLDLAINNAQEQRHHEPKTSGNWTQKCQKLGEVDPLLSNINIIDAVDISHHHGEACYGGVVRLHGKGFDRKAYRRYQPKSITPGDDIAAICQTLERHYQKLKVQAACLPDLLVVDGGPTHAKHAQKVLDALKLSTIVVMSIYKGEGRKAQYDTCYVANNAKILHPQSHKSLNIIQQIRDEAHRFAIASQRKKSIQNRLSSSLDHIDGIGKIKRKALLEHFGGMQGIKRASIKDLCQVKGINEKLAHLIFNHLS